MKRIFALVLLSGVLTSLSAQPANQKDNKFEKTNGHNDNKGGYDSRNKDKDANFYQTKERSEYLKKTNDKFDRQVRTIKNNRRLKQFEKDRQIAMLERQRDQRVQQILHDNRSERNNDRFAANNARRH